MSGRIDLRDDRDETAAGVVHNFLIFLLRVVTTSFAADLGAAPDLRKPRPGFDLDAPALVVGEMQVQAVDLVVRRSSR